MHNGLLHDGVAYWARRDPDRIAVCLDDEQPLSYRELARWSDGIAQLLQQHGVIPGDRVAIAAANCTPWVAAAVGILKAGAIVAPFNDRLLGEELAYLADYSDPAVIIADQKRRELLKAAGVTRDLIELEDLDRVRSGAPEDWAEVRQDSSAIAMIIFTSGSTARSKGAMMAHGNYLAKFMEMRLLDERLGSGTRSLMPFGLHSSPGLPWGILFTTTLGGTLFITRKYDAERTLTTLVDQGINFFIGVPLIYDQVSRLAAFEEADLTSLQFARVGGASAKPETLERWAAKGVTVRQLYGMTEVGGGSLIASEEEARAKPWSCGRGLAFSRFRIVNDEGEECPPGTPGHVLLQGPGQMSGYWRDPAATSEALKDGWMHTGDIGVADEEGFFTFVDRSKEMIKSGGFNVSPTEIEGVLLDHGAVAEVAVFAVPDEKFTEVPCACVFLREAVGTEQLFSHCAGRLAGFKLPRYIIPLAAPLPRLANEKVDRRQLKRRFGDPASLPERVGGAPR